MSLEVPYEIDIEGTTSIIIGLSRTKALKIINELNRLSPMKTYLYRRNNIIYIYLGIKKGGFSAVKECSEGMLLYDVRQDSLMICLDSIFLQSKLYLEAGSVKKGLSSLKEILERHIVIIKKI